MKKMFCLWYAVLLVLFLSGCGTLNYGEDQDMELTQEDYDTVAVSAAPAASGGNSNTIQTVSIYTVDSIEEVLVPLKVPMNTERITPEFIIDEVIKNIDEKVEVTEIEVEKSRIYITFNGDYAPVTKCSEKFETLILDCISNSILDNVSYIEEVVFRCDDGNYHSDNFTFGEDEVYSSR